MKKLTYVCIVITVFLSIGLGFVTDPIVANTKGESQKRDMYLNIMTVTKAQALMIDKLVAGKHNIDYLIDGNINSFEYTKEIVDNVSNMDLFLYTGASYEKWINSFVAELNKSNLGVIDLSRGIRLKEDNPFYFLGYDQYKICLYNAKGALQERDPLNREFYETNYNNLVSEIDAKISDEKRKLTEILTNNEYVFLSTTNNYDYLFDSIGLLVQKITTQNYTEVIEKHKENNKKMIIFSNKDQIEEFDFYTLEIEPVYLNCNDLNKAYEDIFIDNIDIIINRIANI